MDQIEVASKLKVTIGLGGDLVVDAEEVMLTEDDVRWWHLTHDEEGTWYHAPSGESGPLYELLRSIACIYVFDASNPRHVAALTAKLGAGGVVKYASGTHPHEPDLPVVWDDEGRCRVCVLLVQLQTAESVRDEAKVIALDFYRVVLGNSLPGSPWPDSIWPPMRKVEQQGWRA